MRMKRASSWMATIPLLAVCMTADGGCAASLEPDPVRGRSSQHSASEGETAIRAQLQGWLEANRRRDRAGMQALWDPKSVCWLPEAPELSNAAAARLAGSDPALRGWSAYELSTDRIVHNVFTETRHFTDTAKTVSRRLRGSELWQRQSDGAWRIIRCVSAPDPWKLDQP